MKGEIDYLNLLSKILEEGIEKVDRTGVGTLSLFGERIVFDLSEGFPLLTTKKVHMKSIVHELLWFLMGDTNIEYLQENGVSIWDAWADEGGNLGPVYGEQWRSWGPDLYGNTVDQIREVCDSLQNTPHSRRHIVSAWNPSVLPEEGIAPFSNPTLGKQALAPCHCLFQFYIREDKLDCQLYQRSADIFLGVPFNIASYALLTHMVAQVCDLEPGRFIHTFGDVHLYQNHKRQAKKQLDREPRGFPTLKLNQSISDIDDFEYEDIKLEGYDPHPAIKGAVAV